MSFYERFDTECKKKGTTPTALLKLLNISTSKITAWKNGSMPGSEWIIPISEALGVSIEYLLTGKETSSAPELHVYHWNHPEDNPTNKKYNAVCKAIYALHGKKKASALLSAILLPNDKPVQFSEAQLEYLAFRTGVNVVFFSDDNLGNYDFEQTYDKAQKCSGNLDFDTVSDIERRYPETAKWEKNYKHLYFEAMQMGVNMVVFEEITDTLSRFSNEKQVEIKVIFEEAVKQYENKVKERMAREFNDMSAESKGEVS